jgi:flagellar basal body-associated protein FliL
MEPIAIVKKRSRIWLVMVMLIIIMLLAAAALWFMGDAPPADTISHVLHGQAWWADSWRR